MKYFSLTIFIISFNIFPIFGQLQKGDMSLEFISSISRQTETINQSTNKNSHVFISPSFGYMVTNRVMMGGELYYGRLKGETSYFRDYYFSKRIIFGPFARYYFLHQNKFSPYLFFRSRFTYTKNEAEWIIGTRRKDWVFSAAAGFGAQYFISPNIAVQANISTTIFQNDYYADLDDLLNINIGIQTFINDRSAVAQDLLNNYLKKGNYVISGSGNLTFDDNPNIEQDPSIVPNAKPILHVYNFAPRLKYFTSESVAVILGAELSGYGTGTESLFTIGTSGGVEKYLQLGKRFYFVPSGTLSIRRSRNSYKVAINSTSPFPIKTSNGSTVHNLNGNIILSLKYFSKGTGIWSVGADYTNANQLQNSRDKRTNKWCNYFLEYEYFFRKNLSLTGRVNFFTKGNKSNSVFILGSNGELPTSNFNFGLNYFIFNNKKE